MKAQTTVGSFIRTLAHSCSRLDRWGSVSETDGQALAGLSSFPYVTTRTFAGLEISCKNFCLANPKLCGHLWAVPGSLIHCRTHGGQYKKAKIIVHFGHISMYGHRLKNVNSTARSTCRRRVVHRPLRRRRTCGRRRQSRRRPRRQGPPTSLVRNPSPEPRLMGATRSCRRQGRQTLLVEIAF